MDARSERWWHRRARKRAERAGLDPETFFDELYPRAILENAAAYRVLKGTVAIVVRGTGAWTLNLGDAARPVSDGAEHSADATLCFVPTAFGDFLRGTLHVKAAIAAGDLSVRGDVRLIEKLGNLLMSARSMLASRTLRIRREHAAPNRKP